MAAVEMTVISPRHVGLYLTKIAKAAPGERPQNVEALLGALAQGIPNAPQPHYDGERRQWRLAGILEVTGVERDAALDFLQSTSSAVKLRLPDKELLDRTLEESEALDAIGGGPNYVPSFYGDYLNKTPRAPTNTEFLYSRIADYVFSSCR
ncbi:hypothetical protein HDIA_2446 [Hartmannibacter diazotrophicus]|uniref:Uncharacterized protein n=1 Tax=Hartmannibacter diazotrophicus TaxID=1482074 RepID=A0A2C9D6Q5_9HYPH|nr:hypothetical protein [Hartmannibacter diazotrophicus]SON55987.1 hypothetical protein HDIA_2446 [Hartmannibacter diazotrophicus]